MDTKSGRRYAAAIPGCGIRSLPATRALSFPVVLVSCGGRAGVADRQELIDVRNRTARSLPSTAAWFAVGRFWLEGDATAACPDRGQTCRAFYDRRSGSTRFTPYTYPQLVDPDLDSSTLASSRPCAPFQANSETNDARLFERPYALAGPRFDHEFSHGLYLGRCGSRHLTLLDPRGGDAELSVGIVTWDDADGTVRAYVIANRRRYRWRAPGTDARFNQIVSATHTRNSVIIGVTTHEDCSGEVCTVDREALYSAPLPQT